MKGGRHVLMFIHFFPKLTLIILSFFSSWGLKVESRIDIYRWNIDLVVVLYTFFILDILHESPGHICSHFTIDISTNMKFTS